MSFDWLRELTALHFLRPGWLWALFGLPLLVLGWRLRQRQRNIWRDVVDPHLLPALLASAGERRSRIAIWIAALAYALAILALAGPAWRQAPQPLWQSRAPLVIALDLSSASMAADLPPSRLSQARAKLATLLRERAGGQVALVAFAGDAFTVAPLTDDAANVALFLDALQPDVMPVDGQRVDRAIAWSQELLERTGATGGDILVMGDHADARAVAAAGEAAANGFRVSALGTGTAAGAAYRRAGGTIGRARLDEDSLQRLAATGNGRYAAMSMDDADLRALRVLDPPQADAAARDGSGRAWQDEGYWLLPPLLLLALLAFRRRSGAVAGAVLLCLWLPATPAHAAELWRRPDQAAHARLVRGNAAYRQGDFAGAAQAYTEVDSADGHYNRGNALAKAGRYPQAIAAYDEALRRQPGMEDAIANKRAVEEAMKRQRQGGSASNQQQQGQGEGDPRAASGDAQQQQQSSAQNSPPASSSKATPQPSQSPSPSPSPAEEQQATPAGEPADQSAQQQADRAQRERMERALQQARERGRGQAQEAKQTQETPQQRERRVANEAWLKRIPDDPGGLLRAKFRLEYERRMLQGRSEE